MSILDQIANPQFVESYLGGVQAVENIKSRRQQNYLNQIKTGMALQEMQAQQQQLEQRQKGQQTIREFLTKQAQPREQRRPFGQRAGQAPEVTDQQGAMVMQTINSLPTEQIDQAGNFTALANQLAASGNMDMAETFYGLSEKFYNRIQEQTKIDRERKDALFEIVGRPFRKVAQLEERGNTEQAKLLYNQVMDIVANDPRFLEDEDVQQVLKTYKEYVPGMGKYLYTSTAYAKNAREADKAGTYTKTTSEGMIGVFDKNTNQLKDYLRDEKGKPIKDWRYAKEEGVQARADARLEAQQSKQEQTAKKFEITNTDSILRYKRQEEKDLREVKSSLNRALTLAATGKNMSIVDKLLKQSMSKWENTSVRAYAELQQFANIGDIEQRVAGSISQFITGEMTDEQRRMVMDTAKTLLNEFVTPALDESNNYWRRIAGERDLDPDQIAPYNTKEEVGEDYQKGIITREQAERILKKPRFKWPTE